jgi:hypothetical protein
VDVLDEVGQQDVGAGAEPRLEGLGGDMSVLVEVVQDDHDGHGVRLVVRARGGE